MVDVMAWTDGSCLRNPGGPGGYAALLRFGDYEREIVGGEVETTNNRMELTGAIAALEELKRPTTVMLHADSQYVIRGATQWLAGWMRSSWLTTSGKPVANRDLWLRLANAARPHSIDWRWVKGHAGQKENERVDELAGIQARLEAASFAIRDISPPLVTPAPPQTPERATVLARVRAVVGHDLSNAFLRDIGARAARSYRVTYRQDPPRVEEAHPELGRIQVFFYPDPSYTLVDTAIAVVLEEAKYTYTAPPPPAP